MTKFKNVMVAALVAVAAIGCGVTPDESVTTTDTATTPAPTAPVDPTTPDPIDPPTIDPTVVIIVDECEAFGLVPTEDGLSCEPDHNDNMTSPDPIVIIDNCDAFGLVYDNITGDCVDPNPPVVAEAEKFNFTLTPGVMKIVATFDGRRSDMTNYYIRNYAMGSYNASSTVVMNHTEWTFLRPNCEVREFQLVAKYADGTKEETNRIAVAPLNCNLED